MKARTIRHITAALAMLALLAGHAMTGSKAVAQEIDPTDAACALLNGFLSLTGGSLECTASAQEENLTDAECMAAWESSWAYSTCDDLNVQASNDNCAVRARCETANGKGRISTWWGPPEETNQLENCSGELEVGC